MRKVYDKAEINLQLQPKQQRAQFTPATELLYGGAAGGGKSHLMRTAATFWCTRIPGLQVYLFRRISDDIYKNHMEGPTGFYSMLKYAILAGDVKINQQKNYIHFTKTDAKIHLCHCQYEKDRFKYQGAEIHVLLIDELTHFTDKIYRYLRGRVRSGGLKVPEPWKSRGIFPRIICGSNPGGIGHNWVKASFIDVAPAGKIVRMPKKEGGMRRQYIPARLADNPKLTENDPEYEDRLEGLGDPELVRAMKEGDWDIVSGGAFDDVWKTDVHIIKPFRIPAQWYIDRSFDWGSSAPFSVGWWAESDGTEVTMPDGSQKSWPKGTLFRFDEWYGWNGSPNQGCKMLAVDIAKEIRKREMEMYKKNQIRVRPGPADNSIFDTENGVCIAADMEKVGVRWTRSNKSPGSRINGLERFRQYIKASTVFPMEEPGLFVFDNCVHFKRCIPVLPRDENKRDDIDTKAEDHNYDESRYRITDRRNQVTTQEV